MSLLWLWSRILFRRVAGKASHMKSAYLLLWVEVDLKDLQYWFLKIINDLIFFSSEDKNASSSASTILRMEKIVDVSNKSSGTEVSERITYAWSDVNVYVTAKKQRLWERAFLRSHKPVEQKHILKDGNWNWIDWESCGVTHSEIVILFIFLNFVVK